MALKYILILFIFACMLGCNNVKHNAKPIAFESNGNLLDGIWVKPSSRISRSTTLIFIHGDGAMDAKSKGFFTPIFNTLADNGISSFSWHKPGISSSAGNWLAQSMVDRAQEVRDAIKLIKQQNKNEKIGVIGFSQAGWVIPYLYDEPLLGFAIMVSPAVNWRQQSQYLTWQRLVREGLIEPEDEQALNTIEVLEQQVYALIKGDFETYQHHPIHQHPFKGEPISDPQRFGFVQKNIDEDATANLAKFGKPILALFGDSDLNVDVEHSQQVYSELAKSGVNITTHEFANATHQLLKADEYLMLTSIQWYAKFSLESKDAFAPNFLNILIDWVKKNN